MGEDQIGSGPGVLDITGPLLALIGVAGYLGLVAAARGTSWPRRRTVLWIAGNVAAVGAVSGPLADAADNDYVAHLATHLLLGMLAPLLLVLAAPLTLLLRALPVGAARRVSRRLAGRPVRILTEPIVAATLNVWGLWLLYTSELYALMHHDPAVHLLIHTHMFLAGYLFTVAIISVDPLPHRRSYRHRSIVLVLALAGHDILAKRLYLNPPAGVSTVAAETGSMAMYYGGDAVDLALIVLLCARWYRSSRPRSPAPHAPASTTERRPGRSEDACAHPWETAGVIAEASARRSAAQRHRSFRPLLSRCRSRSPTSRTGR